MMTTGQQQNGYFNGFMGQQQPRQIIRKSTLSPEKIAALQSNTSRFNIAMTEDELARGICNHVDANGNQSWYQLEDGRCYCPICDRTWDPNQDTQPEQIQDASSKIVNILQTIKMLYATMPAQVCAEFMQIIPLIEKVPALYDLAVKNFSQYESNYNMYQNQTGNVNPFSLFQALSSGGFTQFQQQNMFGGFQQPNTMMQGGYQQPNAFNMNGYSNMDVMSNPAAANNAQLQNEAYLLQQKQALEAQLQALNGQLAPAAGAAGNTYEPGSIKPIGSVPIGGGSDIKDINLSTHTV